MSVQPIALSAEQMVEALIDVMADLSEVLRAENDLLRQGMPAALAQLTDRKNELAQEYAHLLKLALADRDNVTAVVNSRAWRAKVVDVSEEFHAVSQENLTRLDAAMFATRRRIEAVMSAIRRRDREGGNYRRNGMVQGRRTQPGRASYSA